MFNRARRISLWVALLAAVVTHFAPTPASAVAAPDSPTYGSSNLKLVVDNDYAAFYGDSSTVSRILFQSNVDWMTQVSSASSITLTPTITETYVYIAVMGGGGTEDFAGYLNGQDIVFVSGAQVASGRSPLGSGVLSSPYIKLEGFVSGYSTSNAAAGTQDVTVAQMQTMLTGISWTSAVGTTSGTGNVPNYKTTGVCCDNSSGGGGGILSGKGWNFPSNSLVVFRYPLSSLGLPVSPGDRQVIVDWSAPAGGTAVTGYQVEYKKSSDPDSSYRVFSNVVSPTTIETVTGLTNGVDYSFRVASTNSGGMSAYSTVKTATPFGNYVAAPSISGTFSKGIAATLTLNQSFSGKVRFLFAGRRIPGCLNVSTTGTSPNFTATCTFKPPTSGRIKISAYITSTDSNFSSGYSDSVLSQVGRRSNTR